MSEAFRGHNEEKRPVAPSERTEPELSVKEVEIIDKARRWSQAVTAAEHHDIYASSARDYISWAEQQGLPEAS